MINEEQTKEYFAKKLSELRKSRGMTQAQLALSLNYSDKAVSKWERGESIPDAYTLLKISKLFSVPVDELLDEDFVSGCPDSKKQSAEGNRAKRIFIPVISALGAYFAASLVFFVMKNIPSLHAYAPLVFLFATVAAFIVLTVFASMWWKRIYQCVCVSGIIWSVGLCIAIPAPTVGFNYIFIPCAILQCICILIYVFIYFLKKQSAGKD